MEKWPCGQRVSSHSLALRMSSGAALCGAGTAAYERLHRPEEPRKGAPAVGRMWGFAPELRPESQSCVGVARKADETAREPPSSGRRPREKGP